MSKDLQLEIKELQTLALLEIKDILQCNKKSLKDYPAMPFARHVVLSQMGNKDIYAEQNYDKAQLQQDFETYFSFLIG